MKRRSVNRMRMKRQAQYVRCVQVAGMAAVVMIAVAGAVFAGLLVYDAPALRIDHIYVVGCEAGVAEEVLAHAELYRGHNIVAADLRSLRTRIERNPWVAQAVIRRQYPDTLELRISVRDARAVVALDEDFLVDADGVFFLRAPEHRVHLPVLFGLQRDDFENDSAAAERMITEGLRIIAALEAHALPVDEYVRITCSRELGFTLQTEPDGPEIYLGFDAYHHKLAALPRMLADLRSRGLRARFIHLQSPERAFVRLAEQEDTSRQARARGAHTTNMPS
jgi:cell division septal protein FtsQ